MRDFMKIIIGIQSGKISIMRNPNVMLYGNNEEHLTIYSDNQELISIGGIKDLMLFSEIVSYLTLYAMQTGDMELKNKIDYIRRELKKEKLSPLEWSISRTWHYSENAVTFNLNPKNIKGKTSYMFSCKKNEFSDFLNCWKFVDNIMGQSRVSLDYDLDYMLKVYSEFEIFYIVYMLQYTSKTWCLGILKELARCSK